MMPPQSVPRAAGRPGLSDQDCPLADRQEGPGAILCSAGCAGVTGDGQAGHCCRDLGEGTVLESRCWIPGMAWPSTGKTGLELDGEEGPSLKGHHTSIGILDISG